MKKVKYYAGHAVFSLMYAFCTALTSAAILCIENLVWLKAILLSLNLLLYVYIVGAVAFKDGEQALKVRNNNDFERKIIIKTGENRPLDLIGEYKVWKGFLIGAVACIPVVLLLLIHTILISIDPTKTGVGTVVSFLYMCVFAFFRINVIQTGWDSMDESLATNATIAPELYYVTLLMIPILILTIGIGYFLGAKREELKNRKLKERQRIYSGVNS